MKLLEVVDFGIEFHDHDRPEQVVEGVNFSLEQGGILGIVGESGSGKSMTALAVAGLLPRKKLKKEGHIYFEGKDVLRMDRTELRELQGDEICMIFQEPQSCLNPVMRIGPQVEEALRVHRKEMSAEERRARALERLRDVELTDAERVYDSYPHELSGGMRQRVMIAAAMVGSPHLLIADEPTTALDVTVQAQIIQLLKRLNEEEKLAILFISHDLSLIRQISHSVLVMQHGKLVESGPVERIFEDPQEEYTKNLIAAIPKVKL